METIRGRSALCARWFSRVSLKDAQPATALEIDAVSDFYQGRLSPKIESARRLGDEELEQALADLAPVSPFDPQAMRSELCGIIADISDESLRATILYAINEVGEAYFTSTAATKCTMPTSTDF
ncbi:MAG: hypothetical protein ACLUKN_13820 [Bacilli bacterium]